MRLRLNTCVAGLATLLAYLLVPAAGLAATTTETITKTVTSGGASAAQHLAQVCGPHRTISALGLLGLLLLSFAIATQVAIVSRRGIHNIWVRRGLGSAVIITNTLGVVVLFLANHMGILALVGFAVWTVGVICLYFLGFGRPAIVLPHTPEEHSGVTRIRRLWNTAFTVGTLIGITAGPAMIFAGGVHFTWG